MDRIVCAISQNLSGSGKMIAMLTDAPPRKKNGTFLESDRMQALPLPPDERLP